MPPMIVTPLLEGDCHFTWGPRRAPHGGVFHWLKGNRMLKLVIAGVLASSFLLVVSVALSGCFDAARPPAVAEVLPPLPPVEVLPPLPPPNPLITIPPRPKMPVHTVAMRVTACSPDDPKDREYYRIHGYEGGVYGVAADTRHFPKGTWMRVPGYLARSAPNEFWAVDSAGGSVIRRSSRRGLNHIDVKFRTYGSAKKWGSQQLNVEVVYASEYKAWQQAAAAWDCRYAVVASVR